MTDDDGERIQAVINAGCVTSLVNLLQHEKNSIIVPALRSIGNIVTGNDAQVFCTTLIFSFFQIELVSIASLLNGQKKCFFLDGYSA